MTPTTYGRDFAYCLKSHGGVRGFNASLWRFLLRCTLFCHSVATFLTSVSSYEGGCGFEVLKNSQMVINHFLASSCKCTEKGLGGRFLRFSHFRRGLGIIPVKGDDGACYLCGVE